MINSSIVEINYYPSQTVNNYEADGVFQYCRHW